jgi:type VI secretion system secreted protein Hcp
LSPSLPRGLARRVTMIAVPVVLAAGAGTAVAAAGDQPAAAATRSASGAIFLKLDGIQGESADAQHLNEIDVKSFDVGVKNSGGAAGGGGGGAGRATFSAVRFTKLYDKSSPALMQHVATGQHIPKATFTFRRPGPHGDGFLTYKLSDVIVSEYEQGGDDGTSPLLEHVALTYAKLQVSYLPAAGPPPVTGGWNIPGNSPA